MNSERVKASPQELFESNRIFSLLNKYLELCKGGDVSASVSAALTDGQNKNSNTKPKRGESSCFPNLAGFCRFIGISPAELEAAAEAYPHGYGVILATLEDEALNSDLSASLLTAYLKHRCGYERTGAHKEQTSQLQISFEHNIYEDGQ